MRELRQRVGLVDDLRQLAAAEEVLDGRRDALGVDERPRRHVLLVADLMRSCTVRRSLRKPLRSSSAASSSMVRSRRLPRWSMSSTFAWPARRLEDVADGVEVVERPQRHLRLGDVLVELAVDAEAADLAQAVAVGVLELLLEQLLGLLELRRVAGPQPLVDLEQRPPRACWSGPP